MKCTIQGKYGEMEGNVVRHRYIDGSLALLLNYDDGDMDKLSINLCQYAMTPGDNCIFVKDYSEHEGLAQAMEKAGLGHTLKRVWFGLNQTAAWIFYVSEAVE